MVGELIVKLTSKVTLQLTVESLSFPDDYDMLGVIRFCCRIVGKGFK